MRCIGGEPRDLEIHIRLFRRACFKAPARLEFLGVPVSQEEQNMAAAPLRPSLNRAFGAGQPCIRRERSGWPREVKLG